MDSFKEFAIKDTHNHADFAKMYSCYASYVGRQRSNGISTVPPVIHFSKFSLSLT